MFVSCKDKLKQCVEVNQNCAECSLHKENGGCCEGIDSLISCALSQIDYIEREKGYLSKELISEGKMTPTGVRIIREQAIKEAKYLQKLRDEIDMLRKQQPIQINIDEAFKKECEHEIEVARQEAYKEFASELLIGFHPLHRFDKLTLRWRIACLLRKKRAELDKQPDIGKAALDMPKE